MKIALVRPLYGSKFGLGPPFSLGYLSIHLRSAGFRDITLIDGCLDRLSPHEAVWRVPEGSYGERVMAGIQVMTGSHLWAREFIAYLKHHRPDVTVVVGGPHVTALRELAMDFLGADYGFCGEADIPLTQLAAHIEGMDLPLSKIDGLLYREGSGWGATDNAMGFLENLNARPLPDWTMLAPSRYFPFTSGATSAQRGRRACCIITSRGCPYSCTFCASGGTNQRRIRYRAPDNIIEEMLFLKNTYGVDEIMFSDDNLTCDMERADELFDLMLREKVGLHWRCPNGVRADRLTEGLVAKMAQAGCYQLGIGVESGNVDVLKRIRKHLDLAQVERVVEWGRKWGIETSGFFMVGLQGENDRQMRDTLRFALQVPFDRIQVCDFIPYPGSADFDDIFNRAVPHLFRANVYGFHYKGTMPEHGLVERGVVLAFQKEFIKRFYLRPRVLWSMLKGLRWRQVLSILRHPFIRRWFSKAAPWFTNEAGDAT